MFVGYAGSPTGIPTEMKGLAVGRIVTVGLIVGLAFISVLGAGGTDVATEPKLFIGDKNAPDTMPVIPPREIRSEIKRPIVKLANQPVAKINECMYTPYEAAILALRDLEAVTLLNNPDLEPHYIRYLSLHNFPCEERLKLKQTVDFVVNSLNRRRRTIVRTAAIPDVTNPVVVRVNLLDYSIEPSDWDKLAEQGSGRVPLPDPYFHLLITKQVDVFTEQNVEGKDAHGRLVTTVKRVKTGSKMGSVSAAAPWLATDGGANIGSLIKLTNSANPILRADWFVTYAMWAPAYYTLLGLDNKETSFAKLVALDLSRAKKNVIAAVSDSKIVTLNNRLLSRYPTVNAYTAGYYWETHDTDTGIDAEDYLDNLVNFDRPSFTAKEIIATLPNTLQAYALTDNKGGLLNVAAPNIAIHGDIFPTKLQDKQVYAGRSCVICHDQGMHKINDLVRSMARDKIALMISDPTLDRSKSRSISEKIKDAFSPDLTGVIVHDQAIYTEAIRACNGLTPKVNAAQFEDFVWRYVDQPVTLQMAAYEVGMAPKELEAYVRQGINIDYAMTGWLQNPPINVSRTHWEKTAHAKLMLHLLASQAKK